MNGPFSLLGTGWVTPLGRSVPDVCEKISCGEKPPCENLEVAGKTWPFYRADPSLLTDTGAFARLRRSGTISHMALAAAMDAVASAGLTAGEQSRLTVLFATSDGGVNYTRRFFAELESRGPGAGSPLLFPETVYNAPASHIAAWFQSDREATAMVGDAAVALSAISAGQELLASGTAEHVLIVAANECDAISAAGYSRWKFLRQTAADHSGNVFSEGAAAIVLGRSQSSKPVLRWCREGNSYFSKKEAAANLRGILVSQRICPSAIFSSCQRTPLETIENDASHLPGVKTIDLKTSLGEGLAFTAMAQMVAAAHHVESCQENALVSVLGFAGGVAAALMTAKQEFGAVN
jgi:hypothetical protein